MDASFFAIIRSSKPSFWNSCILITNALEESYQEAYPQNTRVFYYDDNMSAEELTHLIKALDVLLPKEIIFIDHYPSYTRFLKELASSSNNTYPLSFHAYGDFTYYCQEYLCLEAILKKHPVKIFGASKKSSKFIEKHLVQSKVVSTIPFPIKVKPSSSPEASNPFRTDFKITKDTFVVCYTGRLSTQKNTLTLLAIMEKFLSTNPDVIFFMAGSFDNFGTTYVGADEEAGEFEKRFYSALIRTQNNVNGRIHYVNNLDKVRLDQLYQVSDLYISLSLYHNEDFGMAPLEAATNGCALLLTDWGGYSDFKLDDDDDCRLVKVHLTDEGLSIKDDSVLDELRHMRLTARANRKERATKYHAAYSTSEIAKKIIQENDTPHGEFHAFSHVPRMYFWINQGMTKLVPKKGTAYEHLYGTYFE